MTNYLWHKVSEEEKEQIEDDARELILKFGDALEKVGDIPDAVVEREKDVREEISLSNFHPKSLRESHPLGKSRKMSSRNLRDEEFRDLMFENAPDVKDGCIVGEKGGWVK